MKRLLSALVCAVAACAPFQEPAPLQRETASTGGDAPKSSPMPYRSDAGPLEIPDAGCCAVRFALPAGPDETAAALFGFADPLRTPVPLVRDGGAWEATVCMPLATQVYGYRLFIPTGLDGGGLFELVTHNPNAPVIQSSEFGSLNRFAAADAGTCSELVTAPHGDATPRDAGNVFTELDAGDPDGGM